MGYDFTGKPGPGRPKGSKNQETLDRETALAEYRKRAAAQMNRLLDKQLSLADGCQYLYVVKKDDKGKRMKAELVKDEATIRAYIDGDLDGNGDEFYYITTERPDNSAIVSVQDRTYGKAAQSIDHTTNGKDLGVILYPTKDESPLATDGTTDGGAAG